MRVFTSCLTFAISLGVAGVVFAESLVRTAPQGYGSTGKLSIAAGGSIGSNSVYGHHLTGAGPFFEFELGLIRDWSLSVDYRRHSMGESADEEKAGTAMKAKSRNIGLTLRHSIFVIRGDRYLDLHAGLGTERIDVRGRDAVSRRYARVGITMFQPGRMYHVSNHLEIRIGIDVVVAAALRDAGQPVGCTGPCTTATSGPAHDVGVFGTFAVTIR